MKAEEKALILSLILVLFLFKAKAQECRSLVFKNSDSYQNRKNDSTKIKEIEYKIWQNALEVKNEGGKKEKIKVDSIWGYQTEKCVIARWIKEQNTFFYIRESKGIVVYLGRIQKGMRHTAGQPDGRSTTSVFETNFFWGSNHSPDYYPFLVKRLILNQWL